MNHLIFFAILILGQYSVAAIVPPTEPQLETCAIVQGEPDPACEQRNQQKQSDYQIQLAGYNQAVLAQDEAAAAAATEQELITKQEDAASARAAAEEAAKKNKESNDRYKQASGLCTMASIGYLLTYASSSGTDASSLYKSIAFAALAVLANDQADSNESSGYEACLTSKKLAAASGINCGDPPTPGSGYPQDQIGDLEKTFSPDGTCIGAPEVCARLLKELPPGVKVKDALYALKNFDKNKAYKVSKDGSITTKDGKTYTAANFANEAAMTAAGMPAADAKALAAKFKGMEKESITKSGGFGDTGGSSLAGGKSAAPNGDITGLEKNSGEKRELASAEGLSKDFKGERIGVAGDNIFKMMNRRYKLKVAQDNFIAPTP